MENKTAMQIAIDELSKGLDYIKNIGGDYYDGQKVVYESAIEMLTELLTTEKEQIKDAYNQGYREGEEDAMNNPVDFKDISEFSNAEQYYSQTYQQS